MEWTGDGRKRVDPPTGAIGQRPAAVKIGQARDLIRSFETHGHSQHSGQGSFLWVIIDYCETYQIPYNLRAEPGNGYFVERKHKKH
jgi:hypothetical protein